MIERLPKRRQRPRTPKNTSPKLRNEALRKYLWMKQEFTAAGAESAAGNAEDTGALQILSAFPAALSAPAAVNCLSILNILVLLDFNLHKPHPTIRGSARSSLSSVLRAFPGSPLFISMSYSSDRIDRQFLHLHFHDPSSKVASGRCLLMDVVIALGRSFGCLKIVPEVHELGQTIPRF